MTDAPEKTAMRYRKLGWSDIDISVIGLGAISFGDPDRVVDPAASARIVHECLDRGINFFDTANAYGHGASEEHLGTALGRECREPVEDAAHALVLLELRDLPPRLRRRFTGPVLPREEAPGERAIRDVRDVVRGAEGQHLELHVAAEHVVEALG